MATVTVIPSTINPLTKLAVGSLQKRRVAAYARVSTDSDEQYTSYEAQIEYYTKKITERPDWEFVQVYTDEGITGTNTKRREGFNNLISDALAGKIDLIITKSISRFARNTLDTITYTRKLKAQGIEVFFEKENLWSLDPKSEFIMTICASIAQEESRSISQNVTMGKRWSMQAGKVSMAFKTFLGYEKKPDGSIGIDEEQAEVVRLIYRLFLIDGKTTSGIAKYLNDHGIATPSGREGCVWSKSTVDSILTNEKYKGDALLQKTFMVDFLEHRSKKNEGEVPSYYVENSHPAIIDRDEWELVQEEFARRQAFGRSYSSSSPFSTKLICGDCGGFYGAKVWHSNSKYKRTIYQCNQKFNKGHEQCETPHLTEEAIKEKFLKAYNEFMVDRDLVLQDTLETRDLLTDTTAIEEDIARLYAQLEKVSQEVSVLVKGNTSTLQDQNEYSKRYAELASRYESLKAAYDKACRVRDSKKATKKKMDAFITELQKADQVLTEWDIHIWQTLVESGTVNRDGTITFKFKNGLEATA